MVMAIYKILQNPSPFNSIYRCYPVYNNTYIFHSLVEKHFPENLAKCLAFKTEKKALETLFKAWCDVASLQNVKKVGGLLWNKGMEVG